MKYSSYVKETIAYGIVGLIGLILMIYFGYDQKWVLTIISVLIAWVAFDNFFCGTRLSKTGCKVRSHYVIPPIFKK